MWILLQEQSDWLADTDEEIDEQELEAHYSYMAKIQEVPNADSGTALEPLEPDDQNDVEFVKEKHDELVKQSLLTKSHYEGLIKEKTKDTLDSLSTSKDEKSKSFKIFSHDDPMKSSSIGNLVRTDSGTEFFNQHLMHSFIEEGIGASNFYYSKSPEQNALSKYEKQYR
ncbi:hypothetical protein Tco_0236467 [Tanacetum coccineum]